MILRDLLEVLSTETSIMIFDVTSGRPEMKARGNVHYAELELKAKQNQLLYFDVVFVRYVRGSLQIEIKEGSFYVKHFTTRATVNGNNR